MTFRNRLRVPDDDLGKIRELQAVERRDIEKRLPRAEAVTNSLQRHAEVNHFVLRLRRSYGKESR
jgi:hypothetical protein